MAEQPTAQVPMMAVPIPQLAVGKTRDGKAVSVTVVTVFGTLSAVLDANHALEVGRKLREFGKEINRKVVTRSGGPNGAVLLDKPLSVPDDEEEDDEDASA